MKKRIIAGILPDNEESVTAWLDLESIAEVEISSENSAYPIEGALSADKSPGWRAGEPGIQTIRLLFTHPQDIHRIQLRFQEAAVARTQEFSLRWSEDGGRTFSEIVRQQWNFSPDGSTTETEDYALALSGVTVLEWIIQPDIHGQHAFASVEKILVA
ncbi:MAG: carbohydrate-binding protein [Gammaproteobacteria bacterium]